MDLVNRNKDRGQAGGETQARGEEQGEERNDREEGEDVFGFGSHGKLL